MHNYPHSHHHHHHHSPPPPFRPPFVPAAPPVYPGSQLAYYWTPWSFHQPGMPPNAFEGGVDSDGSPIYVGRAQHEGDLIPAKVIPRKRYAAVAYNGGEHSKQHFEILCGRNFGWTHSSHGHIPARAVPGGRTASGEILYIGRASYKGSRTIGKVHPSHRAMYIPFEHNEIPYHDYEILVEY